jgi:hypothetical protein
MSTKRDAALVYCRRGWSVIPLRWTGTVEDRKRPLLDSWKPYQTTARRKWKPRVDAMATGEHRPCHGRRSGLVALDLTAQRRGPTHRRACSCPRPRLSRRAGLLPVRPPWPVSEPRRCPDGNGSAWTSAATAAICGPASVHGSGHVYHRVVLPEKLALPADLLALILRREAPAATG